MKPITFPPKTTLYIRTRQILISVICSLFWISLPVHASSSSSSSFPTLYQEPDSYILSIQHQLYPQKTGQIYKFPRALDYALEEQILSGNAVISIQDLDPSFHSVTLEEINTSLQFIGRYDFDLKQVFWINNARSELPEIHFSQNTWKSILKKIPAVIQDHNQFAAYIHQTAAAIPDADPVSMLPDILKQTLNTLDYEITDNMNFTESIRQGRGQCYHFAAYMTSLMKEKGIDASFSCSNGHAWTTAIIDNQPLVFDCARAESVYRLLPESEWNLTEPNVFFYIPEDTFVYNKQIKTDSILTNAHS